MAGAMTGWPKVIARIAEPDVRTSRYGQHHGVGGPQVDLHPVVRDELERQHDPRIIGRGLFERQARLPAGRACPR